MLKKSNQSNDVGRQVQGTHWHKSNADTSYLWIFFLDKNVSVIVLNDSEQDSSNYVLVKFWLNGQRQGILWDFPSHLHIRVSGNR